MILTIGKQPVFGKDDLPVPGQCQPYTDGWRLRMFHRGETNELFEGTYYACRRIQIACLEHPVEEIPDVIERLAEELGDEGGEETVPGVSPEQKTTAADPSAADTAELPTVEDRPSGYDDTPPSGAPPVTD